MSTMAMGQGPLTASNSCTFFNRSHSRLHRQDERTLKPNAPLFKSQRGQTGHISMRGEGLGVLPNCWRRVQAPFSGSLVRASK
jgi:hypothetical protein